MARHGVNVPLMREAKERECNVVFGKSTDGRRNWSCLLPGDITAEELSLHPVGEDQDTVAS